MSSPSPTRILTGLAGRDILSSRSPWLHEHEGDAQGLRLTYSLFDFAQRGWGEADLPRLLDAAKTTGFAGLNVTFPFKQAVIAHLDALSDRAARVGAVNTVKFEGSRAIGHNTDASGFAESVRRGLNGAAMGRVVQVGAGGAGSAVAHALLELGVARLELFDTDAGRAARLVEALIAAYGPGCALAGSDIGAALAASDGLVNATPMGMARFPGTPVPAEALHPALWVADIVYFPLETALLAEARRRGCRTLDGSGMVVHQAAEAFEIFTGRRADTARMHTSFLDFVGEPRDKAA